MSVGLHADLTERIIGAAKEVPRMLGPGLDEKIYETSFCVEVGLRNLHFEQQKRHVVLYKGQPVGTAITDLIIDNRAVVEAKTVDTFHETNAAQPLTICASPASRSASFSLSRTAPCSSKGPRSQNRNPNLRNPFLNPLNLRLKSRQFFQK
jgi:GxxExxY protein